jgi:hypothetical protein
VAGLTACSSDAGDSGSAPTFSAAIPAECGAQASTLEAAPATDPDNVMLNAVTAVPLPAGAATTDWGFLPADLAPDGAATVTLTLCSAELPDAVARAFATSLARSVAASAVGADVGVVRLTLAYPESTTAQGTEYSVEDFASHDWADGDGAELDAAWAERRAPAPAD